jgi:hypothetical protein
MRRLLPSLLILSATLAGCAVMTSSSTREVVLDAQFEAPARASFRLQGEPGSLQVLSIADSRCPTDVRCITAGDAVIVVLLDDGRLVRSDTLRLRGTPRSVAFANRRLEIVDVRPYPVSTERDRASVAMLRITE